MTAETKPVVAGLYIDSGPRQLLDLQPASEVSRRECCHEVAARVLGSITIDRLTEEELLANTCGIDWSEDQHDVAIVDDQARVVARTRIPDNVAGFSQLVELLAEHGEGGSASIEIAIETDKGLLVAALVGAGLTVFAINPRAVARYRERHGQAGGKSDHADAVVLANILRTDRHVHRPLRADTELAQAIKATARQHPGSDLGSATGGQPAAVAVARLLSPGAGCLPEPDPPCGRQRVAGRTHATSRYAVDTASDGHVAQAGRTAQRRGTRRKDQQHVARTCVAPTCAR